MYKDNEDNPGTDSASRIKACGDACSSKSGSLNGFDAKGFIIWENDDKEHSGRCFCESDPSKGCTKVINQYQRYDFNTNACYDIPPGCVGWSHFDEKSTRKDKENDERWGDLQCEEKVSGTYTESSGVKEALMCNTGTAMNFCPAACKSLC